MENNLIIQNVVFSLVMMIVACLLAISIMLISAAIAALLIFWGGTRRAITFAIAVSTPTELKTWWTVQYMAFNVALFTLAPTVPILLQSTNHSTPKVI